MNDAVVVFSGEGNHPLAPLLRPGFRHCFVTVRDGGVWTLVDPANGMPRLRLLGLEGFDPAGFYRDMGLTAVETTRADRPPCWPLTVTNCVGMVKAVIGLRAPLVVTPYALYRRLTR